MNKVGSSALLLFTAFVLGGLAVAPAQAQETQFAFDANGGIVFPVEDLESIYDTGVTFGGDFTWWATPQVGLRATGQYEMLGGKDAADVAGPVDVPDMDNFHVSGAVAFRPLGDTDSPFLLTMDVGGGWTFVGTDDFPEGIDPPAGSDDRSFSEGYRTITAGTKVGYQFTEQVGGFVGGDVYWVQSDTDDFLEFGQFVTDQTGVSQDDAPKFNDLWTFPVYAGVQVNF